MRPIHSCAPIIILLLLSTIAPFASRAQQPKTHTGYIQPMDIPLDLSGNFMEPRSNHFHSGLDMRTQGREGIPVRAVADGWVSRIKISPWGYGKAVYIDHEDGHTTVYGHLQRLEGATAEACLDAQYRAKDFSIDIYPDKGKLPVKQGETIALSGNTGSSGGPHLHFEVRKTAGQRAIDPELFGLRAPDRTPPEIVGVRIHPLTDSSQVAPYPGKALGFAAQGGGGHYGLKPGERVAAFGTVGFSINTFDRYDNSTFRMGVRRIELFVDSVAVFTTRFDEVDFDHNRYCNAHVEFGLFKEHKKDYHRCFKLPHNKLRIYGKEPAQGRIVPVPGRDHAVRFVVTDGRGNTSELTFTLHGATAEEAASWPIPMLEGSLFRYDAANVLEEEGVRMTLPAMALYDDVFVRYARKPAPAKAYGPLHLLHDPLEPIHANCGLWIATPDIPERHRSKALIVSMEADGKLSPQGGTWQDGGVRAEVRAFGHYTVMLDTVPPKIANVDLRAEMANREGFTIQITDDLSGIAGWRGTLDGEWILLEYDPKTKTIYHRFDKHTKAPGRKTFKVQVTDDRGNRAEWGQVFNR